MDKELIGVFKELVERASDRNGALTELAKGRCDLVRQLDGLSFNANGEDINGNQSRYKIIKEQADKIDNLIKGLEGIA